MIMMMEDLVLAEFEDLLQEGGNHHIQLHGPGSGAIEPPEDDFDETALKPMDASTLSAHELDQEVSDSWLFYTLQQVLKVYQCN